MQFRDLYQCAAPLYWSSMLLDSPNFRMPFPSYIKLEYLQSAKNETAGIGSAFGQSPYIFSGISSLVGRKGTAALFNFPFFLKLNVSTFPVFMLMYMCM